MTSIVKKHKILRIFLAALALLCITGGLFLYLNYLNKGKAVKINNRRNLTVISPTPTPSPLPTATPVKTYKGTKVKIAVYGDSMVETMGEHMDYLRYALENKYPGASFELLNYGIGAQNAQMGLDRWDASFDRNERHYLPISQVHADIIIMGSFAYNPFVPHDKARHMATLTELVNRSKNVAPKVYILAEIAPLEDGFDDGPNGGNWGEAASDEHTIKIKENLDNAITLSKTLNVGLVNAYAASLTSTGYGKAIYVNPSDGIHPSVTGHQLTARIIANTIKID